LVVLNALRLLGYKGDDGRRMMDDGRSVAAAGQ
jgi:hypothetical protein